MERLWRLLHSGLHLGKITVLLFDQSTYGRERSASVLPNSTFEAKFATWFAIEVEAMAKPREDRHSPD